MLSKVASDIFNQVIQPKWHKSITCSDSPKLWHKSFVKVAKETHVISVKIATQLASSPSLLRIMVSSLEENNPFPTAQRFAVNIAYEMSQAEFGCDIEQMPELWRLRIFASAVRSQWLVSIESSFFLKNKFMDLFDCLPTKLLNVDAECPPELDMLLCDTNALSAAYYKENNLPELTENNLSYSPYNSLQDNANSLPAADLNHKNLSPQAKFSHFDKSLNVA